MDTDARLNAFDQRLAAIEAELATKQPMTLEEEASVPPQASPSAAWLGAFLTFGAPTLLFLIGYKSFNAATNPDGRRSDWVVLLCTLSSMGFLFSLIFPGVWIYSRCRHYGIWTGVGDYLAMRGQFRHRWV